MNRELPPHNIPSHNHIQQIDLTRFLQTIKSECGLSAFQAFGSGQHFVIVLPDAKEEIYTYFKVGKGYRAVNIDEQQADLYGHVFSYKKDKYVFLLTRAAYIYPAQRQRAFVATSGDNEDDFMAHRLRLEQAVVNKNEVQCNRDENGYVIDIGVEKYGPSKRVGQIHTHPDLGCFFSSTDMLSNESTSQVPYAYLVCDPIRNDFLAMVGRKGESAKILFFDSTEYYKPHTNDFDLKPYDVEKRISFTQVATLCREFLKTPGVHGRFRMFYDSQRKAHIKFHARFVCPDNSATIFDITKKNDVW